MEVYLSLNPLAAVGQGWQELQKLGRVMVYVDFLLLLFKEIKISLRGLTLEET